MWVETQLSIESERQIKTLNLLKKKWNENVRFYKGFVHADIHGEVADRTRTDRVPRTTKTRIKGTEPDSWSISIFLEVIVEWGIITSFHCVMEPHQRYVFNSNNNRH